MTLNNVSSHNNFYVERDITAWYNDGSLWDRIKGINGYDEFEGIFPGCYFNMSRSINAPDSTEPIMERQKPILILSCDHFYYIKFADDSDYEVKYHHIVCCPKYWFGNGKMCVQRNDVLNGYYGSKMNTTILGPVTAVGNISGTINEQLYAEFVSHLKTTKMMLSNSVDASLDNDWHISSEKGNISSTINVAVQSVLMSDVEVAGYGGLGSWFDNRSSILPAVFPAFRHSRNALAPNLSSGHFWLRNPGSTKYYLAYAPNNGGLGYNYADNVYAVRPRFVLA